MDSDDTIEYYAMLIHLVTCIKFFWLRQFEMGITAQKSMVRLRWAQATWDLDWGSGRELG